MKNFKFHQAILIGLISACLFSGSVFASPLSDARDAGLVKELPNGFVASQGQVDASIQALVKDVNKRRQAAYEKIAKEHKLTVEQVGQQSYLKRHPPQ